MQNKKLIVGNWKMSPVRIVEAKKIFEKVKKECAVLRKTDAVICPPFVFLSELGKISSAKCVLGAQDAFWEEEGAYTGEVSPEMVVAMKAKYVILGHSERRANGDTDEKIAKKVGASLRAGLTPIVCVGEKKRDMEGEYYHFLEEQIRGSLAGISKSEIMKVIIAYEPVWAIGAMATGVITPPMLVETVIFIRKIVAAMYDKNTALSAKILYGGSVDEKNSGDFLKENGVGGLLVGRASLDTKRFAEILKIAEMI